MSGDNMLELCSRYIKETETEFRSRRLRPRYHFSSPAGWMNDPHAPIWFRGEYHLYYNIYPFQAEGIRPKCWGHAVTEDFTSYRVLPCVLAPDRDYDRDGCASGCVVSRNEMLYAYYTGRNYFRLPREVQCMAVSSDGKTFEKAGGNPILLPDNPERNDFRDPSVFALGNDWVMLVGEKGENGPSLAAYRSLDMYEWKRIGIFASGSKDLGTMWECPSLLKAKGGDYLIISTERLDGMDQRCIYLTGVLDPETVTFTYHERGELDYGADFYAAQFFQTPDGRPMVIAWMNRWKNCHPTVKEGWIGSVTLPRNVKRGSDGSLEFSIPDELRSLRGREEKLNGLTGRPGENLLAGRRTDCAWITVMADAGELNKGELRMGFLADGEGKGGLSLVLGQKMLTVVNETSNHPESRKDIALREADGRIRLDILLDVSCVEICINEREFVTHCVVSGKDGLYLELCGKEEMRLDEWILAEMKEAEVEFCLN